MFALLDIKVNSLLCETKFAKEHSRLPISNGSDEIQTKSNLDGYHLPSIWSSGVRVERELPSVRHGRTSCRVLFKLRG